MAPKLATVSSLVLSDVQLYRLNGAKQVQRVEVTGTEKGGPGLGVKKAPSVTIITLCACSDNK